jgi:hypothetical protein
MMALHRPYKSHRGLVLVAGRVGDVYHDQQHVGVGHGAAGHGHHVLAQLVPGLVHPRRINENDLMLRPGEHPQQPMAGGLRLLGDDGHLLPHQGVDEGGLAHVGLAEHG